MLILVITPSIAVGMNFHSQLPTIALEDLARFHLRTTF